MAVGCGSESIKCFIYINLSYKAASSRSEIRLDILNPIIFGGRGVELKIVCELTHPYMKWSIALNV